MTKNWINTENDNDAQKRIREYWDEMHSALKEGKFWADQIKEYKDEPTKRLSIALNNLPLPGAFREATIATRAIIRAKRKANEEFEDELTLLYWLAAIRSLLLDYAPRLEEPGYNVIESIPAERLRSLQYDYSQLGYEKLTLLSKTDVKWLTEFWGEPTSHKTLNSIHTVHHFILGITIEKPGVTYNDLERNAIPVLKQFGNNCTLSAASLRYLAGVGVLDFNPILGHKVYELFVKKYPTLASDKEDFKEIVKSNAPSLHKLIEIYDEHKFSSSILSSFGQVIALTSLGRIFGHLDLKIWIY
jgi:hypothetical protein